MIFSSDVVMPHYMQLRIWLVLPNCGKLALRWLQNDPSGLLKPEEVLHDMSCQVCNVPSHAGEASWLGIPLLYSFHSCAICHAACTEHWHDTSHSMSLWLQVVGAYSESASDEENKAIKQVALTRPDAPSKDELKKLGYEFAMKV